MIEDALGEASGVSDVISDEVTVETEVLLAFVEAMMSVHQTGHNVLAIQVEGILVLSLALLNQAGVSVTPSEFNTDIVQRAITLSEALPA